MTASFDLYSTLRWIQEVRRAQRARAQPTFFEVAPVSLQKCVSNEAIRRLMRRAGVTRCSINAYTAVRQILSDYLETLISNAMLHAEHRRGNVVTSSDVELAVQQHFGRRLYVATREEHLERFDAVGAVGAYENVRSILSLRRDLKPLKLDSQLQTRGSRELRRWQGKGNGRCRRGLSQRRRG